MSWKEAASVFERAGDRQSAVRFLTETAAARPPNSAERLDIALRLKAMGCPDAAVVVLASISPQAEFHVRFRALLELGICCGTSGRTDEAAAHLLAAREHDPASHWPVIALADIQLGEGRAALALEGLLASYEGLRPDGKASVARKQAEIVARQRFHDTQGRADFSLRCPGRVAALAGAGLMMMVKDEEDILAANLAHHYALGFRSFCLLDNASTDGTAEQIRRFRERHTDAVVLYVYDPIVGYYQSAKMAVFQETLQRYAAIAGIALEWMFFIDADEFLAYAGPDEDAGCAALQARLADPGTGLLIAHWLNAASPELIEPLRIEADPFRTFSKRMSRLEPAVPKIAFRTGLGLEPMMGNHFVAAYQAPLGSTRVLALDDWYMAHFPLRSIAHVRRKVINGGRALLAAKGMDMHGDHWRDRYALYEAHGESVLHEILRQHILGIG